MTFSEESDSGAKNDEKLVLTIIEACHEKPQNTMKKQLLILNVLNNVEKKENLML